MIGVLLSQVDFGLIWRYFGVANQALASIMLWTGAMALARANRNHWIACVPAIFLTAATLTALFYDPHLGIGLALNDSIVIGATLSALCFSLFWYKSRNK